MATEPPVRRPRSRDGLRRHSFRRVGGQKAKILNTEKQGEGTEAQRKKAIRRFGLRPMVYWAKRKQSFSVALGVPSIPLRVKDLLALHWACARRRFEQTTPLGRDQALT